MGAGLSDTILKGTHPRTIPARFGLIWFSSFRGEDLNVIVYQNMPNLHNRHKSAERKISQKNPEYMLNYSLPCSCSYNLSSFWIILKQQWTIKISSPTITLCNLITHIMYHFLTISGWHLDKSLPFWIFKLITKNDIIIHYIISNVDVILENYLLFSSKWSGELLSPLNVRRPSSVL
jgi:hypothetical protein